MTSQGHDRDDRDQSSKVDLSQDESPLDDFAGRVLDVVDLIPAGRVMSYGDIAEYLGWVRGDEQGAGMGPRQVGRVMSAYGGAVAWWRVIHADGTPAPGHDGKALRHYVAEGTPLRSARSPVRVDMRRARWPGPVPRHRGASSLRRDSSNVAALDGHGRNGVNRRHGHDGPRTSSSTHIQAAH